MLLTVFYKDGTEKSYKNVTDIDTGVCYDFETEKPVYEMHEIKFTSFDINDDGKVGFRLEDEDA